jgi:hypothetical protein
MADDGDVQNVEQDITGYLMGPFEIFNFNLCSNVLGVILSSNQKDQKEGRNPVKHDKPKQYAGNNPSFQSEVK